MIKKAQIKFICITMTILFVVFLVIFGAIVLVMNNVSHRAIDRVLADTVKNYLSSGENAVQSKGIIVTFENGSPLIVSFDQDTFSHAQVLELIETAKNRPYNSGKIGDVYYKIDKISDQEILVAADMSENISTLNYNNLNAFLTLLGIYTALFIIVYLFSFSVFRPIRDAFKKQKQFISNASHELKTPITVISANADVLRQDEKNNKWLQNIKTQTERMDTLVADMLTLAKFDEGNSSIIKEDFNLSDEVIGSALPFDALAYEKSKTLTLNVLPGLTYHGDRNSVKKIVNILLDNAVKYASKDGNIILSLKKEGSKIVLSVFNTGSSVPAADANKIFERFYRIDDSRSRESGGSGLGLSIAKSISDANKWKISAVSRPNESMTVTVIL